MIIRPKVQLLQMSLSNRDDEGFTLIELFIVIIIIGILFSVALPSFLNQSNKARQSEAKAYVGSMNRAQQAYYLESNSFANSFDLLGLGVSSTTDTYQYGITMATGSASGEGVTGFATPSGGSASVKAYIGGVKVGSFQGSNEVMTLSVLCEAVAPFANGGADGMQEVSELDSSILGLPKCPTTPGLDYKPVK